MRARGLRISLADVRLVDLRERLAGSTAIRWVAVAVAVAEDMVTVPDARCTLRPAQSAAAKLRFRLCPEEIVQSIVLVALMRSGGKSVSQVRSLASEVGGSSSRLFLLPAGRRLRDTE